MQVLILNTYKSNCIHFKSSNSESVHRTVRITSCDSIHKTLWKKDMCDTHSFHSLQWQIMPVLYLRLSGILNKANNVAGNAVIP